MGHLSCYLNVNFNPSTFIYRLQAWNSALLKTGWQGLHDKKTLVCRLDSRDQNRYSPYCFIPFEIIVLFGELGGR